MSCWTIFASCHIITLLRHDMTSQGLTAASDDHSGLTTVVTLSETTVGLTDQVESLGDLVQAMDRWTFKPDVEPCYEDHFIGASSKATLDQSFIVDPPLKVQNDIEYLCLCINEDCFIEEFIREDTEVQQRLHKLGLKLNCTFGNFLKCYRGRDDLTDDQKQAMEELLSEMLQQKEFTFEAYEYE